METIYPDQYALLSPAEAVQLQKQLREKINIQPLHAAVNYIGGADISFNKFEETVYAGIIILKYPDLIPVEKVSVVTETKFPYISGLLAFREVPALLMAWNKLTIKPDVMVLDGQGIAHERRLGIATHFGLITDTPSVGCAKSRLTGSYTEPDNIPFAESPLVHKNEQVGVVLKTKINCKPVFVSPGHKISVQQSVEIIKSCTKKYRIPEPTRLAHLLVNEVRVNKGIDRGNVLF
ncbi:MAG: deoxyribonuclease V [Niabella sp.]